jgi:hypothetical protein
MQHDFILLDRSGSMSTRWTEALASVNAYVKQLADEKVDTGVTLAVFDSWGDMGTVATAMSAPLAFQIIRDRIIPSTWKPVSDLDATPRGGTPLNDATGKIVALANAGGYDKVALIIMTDGEENASKELSVAQAKKLLDDCRAKGWQVIFLGANFDNARQSTSYGNASHHTVSASAGNFVGTMTMTAGKRAAYGLTGEAMAYTDDEKRKAAGQP